jgi:hypothetical protein
VRKILYSSHTVKKFENRICPFIQSEKTGSSDNEALFFNTKVAPNIALEPKQCIREALASEPYKHDAAPPPGHNTQSSYLLQFG